MNRHLHHGLLETKQNHRLYLDVPNEVLSTISDRSLSFVKVLGALTSKKLRLLEIEDDSQHEMSRLFVNYKKIAKVSDDQKRQLGTTLVVETINTIESYARTDQSDPKLKVEMYTKRSSDGRLGMHSISQWPDLATSHPNQLNTVVTGHMQNFAKRIQYIGPRTSYDEYVYSQLNRNSGATLETNPLGSCSIGTNGQSYESDSDSFEMTSHNIYQSEQQLICYAGLVALVNADTIE